VGDVVVLLVVVLVLVLVVLVVGMEGLRPVEGVLDADEVDVVAAHTLHVFSLAGRSRILMIATDPQRGWLSIS
jgi:predicted regulator of Ras-like GTPase activity (Roadblock/LC7/MglB family)